MLGVGVGVGSGVGLGVGVGVGMAGKGFSPNGYVLVPIEFPARAHVETAKSTVFDAPVSSPYVKKAAKF